MPDYMEYQYSISNELISIKDRVRNMIHDRHWGEDGRYKEVIVSEILRKHLPKNVSVGTGFVINGYDITKQIDIIVYKNDCPLLFQQGDFIIAPPKSVLAIVEVKSKVDTAEAIDAINKATANSRIIGKPIFNGLFSFETSGVNHNNPNFREAIFKSCGIVNNLCFDKDTFMKFWDDGMPRIRPYENRNYAIYDIENLAFGYFISNLIEDVYIAMNGRDISDTLRKMFYPITETKEAHRAITIEVPDNY